MSSGCDLSTPPSIERLGGSGVTHDSQSATSSGVEAGLAHNLNSWEDSDAGLSQDWVRCPSGLASLHHSRLSTRSLYRLYSFSSDRCVCYDNYGLFCFRVGSCWVFIANTFFSPHQQSVLQSTTFRPGCPSHFQVSNRKRKCQPF